MCIAGKECNRAENEETHKRISAQGGQIYHRLSIAFKDVWDRWQFETIRGEASASAEIRDSCRILLSGPSFLWCNSAREDFWEQATASLRDRLLLFSLLRSHYSGPWGLILFKVYMGMVLSEGPARDLTTTCTKYYWILSFYFFKWLIFNSIWQKVKPNILPFFFFYFPFWLLLSFCWAQLEQSFADTEALAVNCMLPVTLLSLLFLAVFLFFPCPHPTFCFWKKGSDNVWLQNQKSSFCWFIPMPALVEFTFVLFCSVFRVWECHQLPALIYWKKTSALYKGVSEKAFATLKWQSLLFLKFPLMWKSYLDLEMQ